MHFLFLPTHVSLLICLKRNVLKWTFHLQELVSLGAVSGVMACTSTAAPPRPRQPSISRVSFSFRLFLTAGAFPPAASSLRVGCVCRQREDESPLPPLSSIFTRRRGGSRRAGENKFGRAAAASSHRRMMHVCRAVWTPLPVSALKLQVAPGNVELRRRRTCDPRPSEPGTLPWCCLQLLGGGSDAEYMGWDYLAFICGCLALISTVATIKGPTGGCK